MWFYIIIGVFFIAMGLAVHVLKWYFLIAGLGFHWGCQVDGRIAYY